MALAPSGSPALLPAESLTALKSTKRGNRTDSHRPAPAPISQSHPQETSSGASAHSAGGPCVLKTPPFSLSLSVHIDK